MQLVEIDTLAKATNHLDSLSALCKEAEEEKLPASINMKVSDWHINNASLLYLLLKEMRFFEPNGCLHVVYEGNNIIACSGVYISDISPYIAVAGVRAYTSKKARTKYVHGDIIFPQQIQWAKNIGAKLLILTFNSYNDKLYKFIIRGTQGKGTAFGLKFSNTYKNFTPHKKQVIIKGVPQYILKLPLEDKYEYDFKPFEYNKQK